MGLCPTQSIRILATLHTIGAPLSIHPQCPTIDPHGTCGYYPTWAILLSPPFWDAKTLHGSQPLWCPGGRWVPLWQTFPIAPYSGN